MRHKIGMTGIKGKAIHHQCLAQGEHQFIQCWHPLAAAGPGQALVRPVREAIQLQAKGPAADAGNSPAQFRQALFGNIAEKSQGQVNGFLPGGPAAEQPGTLGGDTGQAGGNAGWRPQGKENAARCARFGG